MRSAGGTPVLLASCKRDTRLDPRDDVRSARAGALMSVAASLTTRLSGRLRARLPLARRSDERELLDESDGDPAALAANLRDLARLNRLAGGASASIAAIERLIPSSHAASILDVGTGSADLPLAFARHGRAAGARWKVSAIDIRDDVIGHAAHATRSERDIVVEVGDAAALPMGTGSVDVVHSSLLLHHLDPGEASAALVEMRRVARRGVVVNDLRRGPLAFVFGAPLVLALGRSPMTRHDGIVSLRRAYTLDELDELLAAAGLRTIWRSNSLLPRVVTAAVRTDTT